MSTEKRLRDAITARTSNVEPAPNALQRIEEKLMDARQDSTRNRWLGVAAAAVVVAVVVGVALSGDDDSKIDTTGTTVPLPEETTTTTAAAPVKVDPTSAVFPNPATSRRFDDPAALTFAFAKDLLGFSDPLLGDYAGGDSRSGEIEVRAVESGSPTTVFVRQLEDDTWFVLGAASESIRLDAPEPGARIGSPEPLSGAAHAYEGHVAVKLYADGIVEPIAATFVTGRGDAMGDFTGALTFEAPDGVAYGVLVLVEPSAKDGSTMQATVLRVRF